jgi:hypothetical protein
VTAHALSVVPAKAGTQYAPAVRTMLSRWLLDARLGGNDRLWVMAVAARAPVPGMTVADRHAMTVGMGGARRTTADQQRR